MDSKLLGDNQEQKNKSNDNKRLGIKMRNNGTVRKSNRTVRISDSSKAERHPDIKINFALHYQYVINNSTSDIVTSPDITTSDTIT